MATNDHLLTLRHWRSRSSNYVYTELRVYIHNALMSFRELREAGPFYDALVVVRSNSSDSILKSIGLKLPPFEA